AGRTATTRAAAARRREIADEALVPAELGHERRRSDRHQAAERGRHGLQHDDDQDGDDPGRERGVDHCKIVATPETSARRLYGNRFIPIHFIALAMLAGSGLSAPASIWR